MNSNAKPEYDLTDAILVSVIDDLSLWSAPFGLKLLDAIHYKKGIYALDIGFGTGFPLLELAMRLGNTSSIYGLDPWKSGTERTKLRIKVSGLTNVRLFEGVAEHMPFENDFFDLITSNNG
jgi:arsenite methyltransferase